ncbi:MAG: AMP-binding protein [Alphaproteobacteria bacterium]|nr:AMP-binding protein [Alphaproteobacteria bacterium]
MPAIPAWPDRQLLADDVTIDALLSRCALRLPEVVFCRSEDRALTFAELDRSVTALASGLAGAGIKPGERVAVMLPNHLDYVVAFFALLRLGACQVPVNLSLKGESLNFLVGHSDPRAILADWSVRDQIGPALAKAKGAIVIWRARPDGADAGDALDLASLMLPRDAVRPPHRPRSQDTVMISYTSGTTGLPKGAMVTDKMLRISGWGSMVAADAKAGDVMFLWEPIYHIGGAEVLILGLMERIEIALFPRFSASQFWDQVRRSKATHVHYFGGILPILLKEPPGVEAGHGVRVMWGGGCPKPVWEAAQKRFGVRVRECYGMTEASSFTTVNTMEVLGAVGVPMPYFEVRIAGDDGAPLGPEQRGEIWVREREPGYLMKSYFRNPEATAAALQDGWLHTGDLGYVGNDGLYYFAGRKKDSLRRRGENISAFEVERVLNTHPDVVESAVVGVENEIADQDIKVFLKPREGSRIDPAAFHAWCAGQLPRFQVPRLIAFIDEFPKTPTLRTKKELLSKATDDCWDAEKQAKR